MHELGGDHLADVSLNGQLFDHDTNNRKVDRHRDGYANRSGTAYAFLSFVCYLLRAGFMASSCERAQRSERNRALADHARRFCRTPIG